MDLDRMDPTMTRLAHAFLDALIARRGPVSWEDFKDDFSGVSQEEFEAMAQAMMDQPRPLDD